MINGTYRLLYIKWNGVFLPVGCLTSESFSESVDMLETTTRDNNGWKTQTPTNQSYNISFDGLVKAIREDFDDENIVGYSDLQDFKRNRELIEWRIETDFDVYRYSGFGYITELSDTSPINEFVTFNVNILGYGKPIKTKTRKLELKQLDNSLQHELQYNL